MISRQQVYCSEQDKHIEALVEEKKAGRGKNAAVKRTVLNCTNVLNCPRTTFCRFVNPLTTRNPLRLEDPVPETTAAG